MSEPRLTWPEVAAQRYDKLTGRGAEVSHGFQNLKVFVPETGPPGRRDPRAAQMVTP